MMDVSVAVRDSKNPEGDRLSVSHAAWASFLASLKGVQR